MNAGRITRAAMAAISLAATVAGAETYHYWTGAKSADVRTAANWKDAAGNVESDATKPAEGESSTDVLVFTNYTGTVTTGASKGWQYYGYVFGKGCGAITLGNSKAITFLPGGFVRNETESATMTLGYTTHLAAGTNVVDVVNPGATIQVQNGFNGASAVLVKEGKGSFRAPVSYGSAFNNVKEIVMRSGVLLVTSADSKTHLTDCTITFDGDDPSAVIRRSNSGGGETYTKLEISGGCIRETESVRNTGHGFSDRALGYTLSLVGSFKSSYFTGSILDTMSFLWNPSDASQTFTFAKAKHPTTGDLTVGNGSVRLVDGAAFPNVRTVTVKSGATLRAESGVDGAIAGASLVVESGATLYVAEGTTLRFASATVAGEGLPVGVYTTGFVTGGGSVIVAPSAWPEGASDIWTRDDFPAALVAGEAAWYKGASLYGDSLALTAGSGASAVIGTSGVTTAGDKAAYTWSWPTAVYGEQTWTIAAGDTLAIAAPIVAMSPGQLSIAGSGAVSVKSDIPLSSRLVFNGPAVNLGGVTLSGPISIYGTQTISGTPGSTTTFADKLSALNTRLSTNLKFQNGSFLFKGGVESSAVTFDNADIVVEDEPWVMGTHRGTELVNAGPRFQSYGDITLSAPSNVISILNHAFPRGSGNATIRTTVPYALYRGTADASGATRGMQRLALGFTGTSHAPNCTWDLCGCDQEISGLASSVNGAVVTSESPAMLHYLLDPYTQNAAQGYVWYAVTNYVQFTGAAGLSYEGTRMDAALVNVSSTTGRLEVASGRLSLLAPAANPFSGLDWPGGSWPNASATAVSGTGVLALGHSKALNVHGEVYISDGGKLEIDPGVSQRCDNLYIDGVKQPAGRTYGATGSGANVIDDAHFAGGGVLSVTGEHPAFVLTVR